jgi:hypothetical protein
VADLSVTAAQVSAGAAATVAHTVAAVAITAGQTVYTNASGQLALADANVTVAEVTNVSIAVNTAAAGQYCAHVTNGPVVYGAGAAPAAGAIYVVSATAGGICPEGDITSGQWMKPVGVGTGSNTVWVSTGMPPVQHA